MLLLRFLLDQHHFFPSLFCDPQTKFMFIKSLIGESCAGLWDTEKESKRCTIIGMVIQPNPSFLGQAR